MMARRCIRAAASVMVNRLPDEASPWKAPVVLWNSMESVPATLIRRMVLVRSNLTRRISSSVHPTSPSTFKMVWRSMVSKLQRLMTCQDPLNNSSISFSLQQTTAYV